MRLRLRPANVQAAVSLRAAGARRFAFNWALAQVKANQDQWAAEATYDIPKGDRTRPFSYFDLGQGPVEVLCAVHNAVSRGNSKHANRRAPPARRNTATCTLASLRRSRTLSVPAAETALLTGVTVPRPTDRAPTPISHIS